MPISRALLARIFLIIIGAGFAVYFIGASVAGTYLGHVFNSVQASLYSATTWFQSDDIPFGDVKKLVEENNLLKEVLENKSLESIAVQQFRKENSVLLDMLAFQHSQKDLSFLNARVVGRDPLNNNILLLDKGASDGAREGSAVIYREGIIVAKIISVQKTVSRALLLSDSQSEIAAVLVNEPIDKIARGFRKTGLRMELIPLGVNISRGDIVVTSGLDPSVPEGFYVGNVAEVIHEQGASFKSILVAPPVNYSHIDIVAIVQNQYENL